MNRLRLIKTAYTALATLMLAACASDELTDGTVQDLPEGKYPLQISSVTMSAESTAEPWGANVPQTRVSENTNGNSSEWNGGEEITVQLSGTMADGKSYTAEGKYTIGSDKTSLTPVSGKELYWHSTSGGTVTAWYSNYTNGNIVNLSDQSSGLAYVLATSPQTVQYDATDTQLTFTHQLAKVRVTLTGETASFVDNVSIKSYTTCTLTQGKLSNDMNEGEIKMYKVADNIFEANVYPGYQIKEFKANNGAWSTLTTSITPNAANIYKIEIGVTGGTTINLSNQTEDVYTVESGKSLIIDGGGSSLNKRIVIQENAKVMLKDVVLAAPTSEVNTIEIQGTAMLLLSGTNEIKGSLGGCPLAVTSGTLTINGTNNDNLTLIGGDGDNKHTGCLGLSYNANLIINGGYIVADGSKMSNGSGIGSYFTGWYDSSACGSITINGGTIKASGGKKAAGIGTGGGSSLCICGDIIITGGNIEATGNVDNTNVVGGAGIGSGSFGGCGNITISGENTVVTATANNQNCIGIGYNGNCGTVTIKAGATVNNTKYTEDHVGRI